MTVWIVAQYKRYNVTEREIIKGSELARANVDR
jgi:hypothetical protein